MLISDRHICGRTQQRKDCNREDIAIKLEAGVSYPLIFLTLNTNGAKP